MLKSIACLFFGFIVSILGGLIGLGGAEYRLPVLVTILAVPIYYAIPINLLISIATVIFSFFFRSLYLEYGMVTKNSHVIIIMTVGSIIGAYHGAILSNRINVRMLKKMVFVLLISLSIVLIVSGAVGEDYRWFNLGVTEKTLAGFVVGVVIGTLSSLLGVAGGELIIPAIVMIFSLDIKIAGNLSLLISIPTIFVGLYKHFKNIEKATYLKNNIHLPLFFILGSIPGSYIGSYMVAYMKGEAIKIILGIILAISSIKILYD